MTASVSERHNHPAPESVDLSLPVGDDLATSRGTDFYQLDELLTDDERELRDQVRRWCDTEVSPAAAGFWERAEFPTELIQGYARLGVAGCSIVGDGCPGLSPLAEGMIAAELARGDGSIATFNAVHSGLAMTAIALLGSPEQRADYLPRMASCEALGAFALTEPQHGSDVVALETRARLDGDEWVLDGHKRWIGNEPSQTLLWSGRGTTTETSGRSSSSIQTDPQIPFPDTWPTRSPAKPRTAASGRRKSTWPGSGCPSRRGWRARAPGTTRTGCWRNHGRPWHGRR